MTRLVTIPAPVVPLLYSGIELEIWGMEGALEAAFEIRAENHEWFAEPIDMLFRLGELLRVIDWRRDRPPVAADVEFPDYRAAVLAGLEAELKTLRDHVSAPCNGPDLRAEARRDIAIIEDFKARLPQIEASEAAIHERAERAIVLQVLRDDHDERWSRGELEVELHGRGQEHPRLEFIDLKTYSHMSSATPRRYSPRRSPWSSPPALPLTSSPPVMKVPSPS